MFASIGSSEKISGECDEWTKPRTPFDRFVKAFTLIIVATLACALAGCGRRNQAGTTSGHFAEMLIAEIKYQGGRDVSLPSALQSPVSTWRYQRDRFGTVLETQDIEFGEVDKFVRSTYGELSKACITTQDSQQWVISAKTAGVAIWYSALEKGVRVTIQKPIN